MRPIFRIKFTSIQCLIDFWCIFWSMITFFLLSQSNFWQRDFENEKDKQIFPALSRISFPLLSTAFPSCFHIIGEVIQTMIMSEGFSFCGMIATILARFSSTDQKRAKSETTAKFRSTFRLSISRARSQGSPFALSHLAPSHFHFPL